MTKLKLLTKLFFLSFILLSCDEDKSTELDRSYDISIISPSNGDTISSFPIQISFSITNPENINYIQIKLNDNIINEITQFNDIENIAYSPSPSSNYNDAILSVHAFSNFDESLATESITINFSTIDEVLFNDSIALLPGNDFLFTKHLITNKLYVDFLNNINLIGSIISTSDSSNWIDGYGNPILNLEKTHLSYNANLNIFSINDGYDLHPISGISWYGADLFASHMGWRLPTVEQWKYIARADSVNWIYPYGDGNQMSQDFANYGNGLGLFSTTEVGSYNQLSMLGATDIVGNLWEFTSSNYSTTENYVLVGGSYQSTIDNVCLLDTCFTSVDPIMISSTFGFRCVSDLNYNFPLLDCNNDVSNATIDDCGQCTGGNTGLEANYLMDYCGICNGDGSTCADCNGVPGGDALIDDCGECTGGNTELEVNYLMDCAGECNGDALYDNCGTCDSDLSNDCIQDCATNWGGNAYINECGSCICGPGEFGTCNAVDLCGCYDIEANNFSCHLNPQECFEDSNACCRNGFEINCNPICLYEFGFDNFFSNPLLDDAICEDTSLGCTNYENPYFTTIQHDESLCQYWGCTDIQASNYNDIYSSCADQTIGENSTCCEYNFILLERITDTQYNILMQNADIVGGFQINIPNTVINSGTGGSSEEAGFMVSAGGSTILGFSLSGNTIPTSNNLSLLTSIEIATPSASLCIDELVVSGVGGFELNFKNESPCTQ